MAFLMGYVTGPRKSACASTCSGWPRFIHASQAVIYNELATVVAGGVVFILSAGMPNRFALWTFLILWAMRISAKLNLFLGVPNLGERFLPPHLQYLKSFFRRGAMNFLFPLSISGATAVLALLIEKHASATGYFQSVSYALATSLLTRARRPRALVHVAAVAERTALGMGVSQRGNRRPAPPPAFRGNVARSTLNDRA